jgi:hypothetical protein
MYMQLLQLVLLERGVQAGATDVAVGLVNFQVCPGTAYAFLLLVQLLTVMACSGHPVCL